MVLDTQSIVIAAYCEHLGNVEVHYTFYIHVLHTTQSWLAVSVKTDDHDDIVAHLCGSQVEHLLDRCVALVAAVS